MGGKISEHDLENYMVDHLGLIDPTLLLVGRQVPIHGGRLDILAMDASDFVIIELKAVSLNDAAFGQALRYQWSFAPTAFACRTQLSSEHLQQVKMVLPYPGETTVRTILIGPSVDKACLLGGLLGPIEIWLYSVSLNGLSLSPLRGVRRAWADAPYGKVRGPLRDWMEKAHCEAVFRANVLTEAESILLGRE